MGKILISIVLLLSFMYGADNKNWTHTYKYTLKKDELANITVSTSESKGEDKSSLAFRWTLMIKDRVTVFVNHKGYPHQYILYKKRSHNTVRFDLVPDGSNRLLDKSYLLLALSDINQGNNTVDFDIFVKDDKNRIMIEF